MIKNLKFANLKYLVVDNDDVMFNSSPLIQFHVERNWPQFSTRVLKARERAISMAQYLYDATEKEIEKARSLGLIPNLPNFNVVRNDVIKESSEDSMDFSEVYYRKPLLEIGEVLDMAKHDKEMFLENRDATVEADGKLPHGKVPYNEIYQEANWLPYLRENLQALYENFNNRMFSLTAHNGIDDMHGREFDAKGEAIRSIVQDMEHYGLRFHAWEHIEGQRRPRNSKSEKIMQIKDLPNLHGVVLIDDSIENCRDFYNHGGTPILISQNKINSFGFATARSLKFESIARELEKLGFDSDNSDDILQKPKTLTR